MLSINDIKKVVAYLFYHNFFFLSSNQNKFYIFIFFDLFNLYWYVRIFFRSIIIIISKILSYNIPFIGKGFLYEGLYKRTGSFAGGVYYRKQRHSSCGGKKIQRFQINRIYSRSNIETFYIEVA